MFQRWGPFLKNMYLTLCQFSEKNSHPIRPVEGLKLCFDFLCNVRSYLGQSNRLLLLGDLGNGRSRAKSNFLLAIVYLIDD